MPAAARRRVRFNEALSMVPVATRSSLGRLRAGKALKDGSEHIAAAWLRRVPRLTVASWEDIARNLRSGHSSVISAISSAHSLRHPVDLGSTRLFAILAAASRKQSLVAHDKLSALRGSDRGTSMLEAISREPRLSVSTWLDLLSSIFSISDVGDAIRDWGNRHVLEGPIVKSNNDLGRVVERHALRANLIAYSPLGPPEVDALLRDLSDPTTMPSTIKRSGTSRIALGGRPMWATFAETGGASPFDFLASSRDRNLEVRTALGLETRGAAGPRKTLMLIIYRASTLLRFPTVADAGKYDPWNYYFSPAEENEPHGWTKPWDRGGSKVRGRPEVVHESVSMATIVKPLEEI